MNVQFLPEARAELQDAVAYYEGELSGLGLRLWDEIDQHIAWIERNYEVPRLRPGGYRRVNLKIFPYYISYIVRDSDMGFLLSHTVVCDLNIGSIGPRRGDRTLMRR